MKYMILITMVMAMILAPSFTQASELGTIAPSAINTAIYMYIGYCNGGDSTICAYTPTYTGLVKLSEAELGNLFMATNFEAIPPAGNVTHETYVAYQRGGTYHHSAIVTEESPSFQVRATDYGGGMVLTEIWLDLRNFKWADIPDSSVRIDVGDTLYMSFHGEMMARFKSSDVPTGYHATSFAVPFTQVPGDAGGTPMDIEWFINIPYIDTSSSDIGKETSLPIEFSLEQNTPNPFNATTTIEYGLPKDSEVKLEINNVLGQKVRTLVNSKESVGYNKVVWDGKNDDGVEVASGVYFYKLKAGENTAKKRMILLK